MTIEQELTYIKNQLRKYVVGATVQYIDEHASNILRGIPIGTHGATFLNVVYAKVQALAVAHRN